MSEVIVRKPVPNFRSSLRTFKTGCPALYLPLWDHAAVTDYHSCVQITVNAGEGLWRVQRALRWVVLAVWWNFPTGGNRTLAPRKLVRRRPFDRAKEFLLSPVRCFGGILLDEVGCDTLPLSLQKEFSPRSVEILWERVPDIQGCSDSFSISIAREAAERRKWTGSCFLLNTQLVIFRTPPSP